MKNQTEPITDVIFRTFKKGGDVIALFPALPGDFNWNNTCDSYMRTGQHGCASVSLTRITTPTRPKDYRALKRELEGRGYRLRVVSRFHKVHAQARKRAVEGVK